MPHQSDTEYGSLSDEELILLFQKEDREAFSQLVNRYKDRLVNFLFRYTGSRDEAEDIAQDTFLRLYRLKHTYKEVGKFSSWFYTIALNQAKSHIRDKRRHAAQPLLQTFGDEERELDVKSEERLPDEQIMLEDEGRYIQRAINRLEEKHKEIIILRDIQDLEYEEIAGILSIPVGTVKSRINRARESLKAELESMHKPKRRRPA